MVLFVWSYAVQHGRNAPGQKIRKSVGKWVFNFLRILIWKNNATEIFAAKFTAFCLVIFARVAALLGIVVLRIEIMIVNMFGLMTRRMLAITIAGLLGLIAIAVRTNHFTGVFNFGQKTDIAGYEPTERSDQSDDSLESHGD